MDIWTAGGIIPGAKMSVIGRQIRGRFLWPAIAVVIPLIFAVSVAAQSDSTEAPKSPVFLNADAVGADRGRQMSTSAPLVPSDPGTPPLAVGSLDTDTTKPPKSPIILGADSTITHERQLPSGAPPLAVGSPKADTSIWHKPTGALFKSVLFPGWGQYSNGKYQKAAIIFGLESFFIFKSAQYFRKTRDRFDTFQQTQERSDFDAYDDARTTRNKYYWFVAGTIFISMWDAYADAHIKPFEDVRDDDEFWGLEPGDRHHISPPPLSLALTVKF